MVIKITFCNHEEKQYERYVECDVLHTFRGENEFKIIMYKDGVKKEDADLGVPVAVSLIEQGKVIEKFEYGIGGIK